MTRADILEYLQGSLEALSTETGQPTTDTAAGYKLPIDAGLRRIGATSPTAPIIAQADEEAVLALAEYNALRRFLFKVSPQVDTITEGRNFAVGRSQLFTQVKDLLKEAADRCALLGFPVVASDSNGDGASGFGVISLGLDYIEPVPEEWQ